MRAQEFLMILWFVIVISLDKFVTSYYNIILLAISLIIVIIIHYLNKRDRARIVTVLDVSKN